MQGKRLIRLGDREYTIEETVSGDYAVYQVGEDTPFIEDPALEEGSLLDGREVEPGTLVVIVARVVGPLPSIKVEYRSYRSVCWEEVEEKVARRRISRDYGSNTQAVWRELVSGTVIGAGDGQYRRRDDGIQ